MPQRLEELRVAEISLCDNPSCASTDPITKKRINHSTVAIFKRDSAVYVPIAVRAQRLRDSVLKNERALTQALAKSQRKTKDDPGTQDVDITPRQKRSKKEKNMSKLKQVMKSATATREDLFAAVAKKAKKIALRKGCSVELAEGRLWESVFKTASALEGPELRREVKVFKATPAEAELDKRARKLMKTTGLTTFLVPESSQPNFVEVGKLAPGDAPGPDGDEDECPKCGEDVDDEDKFCANCGTKLKKR
jgi:hypothetical protein